MVHAMAYIMSNELMDKMLNTLADSQKQWQYKARFLVPDTLIDVMEVPNKVLKCKAMGKSAGRLMVSYLLGLNI